MYKCKSCGGDLVLNIASQELKCPFCDSIYPVSEFEDAKEIKQQDTYETTIYTCSQCGAEIMTTDSTAVTFCSYCGTEANLEGRLSQEKRPKFIIPFKQTKEQCKSIYSAHVKSQPYAPKEFLSSDFLENFRGIYIPYWELDVGFSRNPELKVIETYTSGSYDYTDEYKVHPNIVNTVIPVPQDASASFDDEISSQIAPFKKEDMEDFNPAYLAGFFADTADVDAEIYSEQAMAMAQNHVIRNVEAEFRSGAKVDIPADLNKRNELFGSSIKGSHLNLFPVWFLTWRKKDRLAYGVINGETGKIAAEIPIDTGKFLITSGILAVILFVISCIASVLILPATVLMISCLAALVVHYFYRAELVSIADRENHANDLGALSGEALKEARQRISRKGVKKDKKIGGMVIMMVITAVVFSVISGSAAASRSTMICLASSVVGIVFFVTSLKYYQGLKETGMKIIALLPLIAEVISFFIALSTPVHDWVYYAGSIIALGISTVVSLSMIKQYNILTTRSIPAFHNREGGNQDVGA